MNDLKTWTDAEIDETLVFLRRAGFAQGEAAANVEAEMRRRAEIRIERGEFGGQHDGAWYAPRPLSETAVLFKDYDGRPVALRGFVETDDTTLTLAALELGAASWTTLGTVEGENALVTDVDYAPSGMKRATRTRKLGERDTIRIRAAVIEVEITSREIRCSKCGPVTRRSHLDPQRDERLAEAHRRTHEQNGEVVAAG